MAFPLLAVLTLAIMQSWQWAVGVGGAFAVLAGLIYGGRKLRDQ